MYGIIAQGKRPVWPLKAGSNFIKVGPHLDIRTNTCLYCLVAKLSVLFVHVALRVCKNSNMTQIEIIVGFKMGK